MGRRHALGIALGLALAVGLGIARLATSATPALATYLTTLPAECSGAAITGITVTRSGTAYCQKADGTLASVAANLPRVESNGLLAEPALSLNAMTTPSDFSNIFWASTNVGTSNPVVTANTTDVLDPLGTNTASKIVFPAVSGAGNLSLKYHDATVTGVVRSQSGMFQCSGNPVYLNFGDSAGAPYVLLTCDGTWRRPKQENLSASTLKYFKVGTDLRAASGGGQSATLGATIYAYGAQLEDGSETTSFHPTSRSADSHSVTNPIPSAATDWCVSINARPLAGAWARPQTAGLLGLGTSAAANSMRLYVNTSGYIVSDTYDAAGALRTRTGQAAPSSGAHLVRYCNRGGQIFHYVDDVPQPVTITTNTGTGVIGTQPATALLGSYAAGVEFKGWIQNACFDNAASCGGTGKTIATLGDSLTAGSSSPAWWSLLDPLTTNTATYNYAVSGQQTSYFYATEWGTNKAKNGHFAYVSVEGTDNDSANDVAAATQEANLQAIYDEAIDGGAKVLIITTSPWGDNGSWNASRQTLTANVRTWQIAYQATHPTVSYIYDAYSDLGGCDGGCGSDGGPDPLKLNLTYSQDGTHRNAAGQARVAAAVKAALGL